MNDTEEARLLRSNVLLIGPISTGKTYSLRTCLRQWPDERGNMRKGAGRDVLVIANEPGIEDTLGDCTCEMGLHWRYIPPLDMDWDTLERMAKLVQSAPSGEAIQKLQDPNKREYTQFLDTYAACANFTCDRCGHNFGDISKLDESFVVAMDGLTGLTRNAMNFCVGLKPAKSWPEYDAVGQQIENLLRKLVSLQASFVLIGHMDREADPIGGFKLTMHTIGNKLAHRLTKDLFSEIVYTSRDGQRFRWSTTEANMDLKARRLPFSDRLEPDFVQILEP